MERQRNPGIQRQNRHDVPDCASLHPGYDIAAPRLRRYLHFFIAPKNFLWWRWLSVFG
jgi:hypothetical protein